MATEQFANSSTPWSPSTAWTELSAGIDASTTTIPVVSGADFPSSVQFRILIVDVDGDDNPIGSETLLVTAGAGTNSFTATRGIEGSTAASHSAGARVYHVLTAAALSNNPGAMTTEGDFNTLDASGNVVRAPVSTYLKPADAATTYVPLTRTVNGLALSSNITLSASDVGALSSTLPGADTYVLFRDGSSLGANAGLTYDKTTGVLARTGAGFLQLGPDTYGAAGWSGYNVGIEIKRDASTEANTAELWIEASLGDIAGASAEGVVAYSRTAAVGATQNTGNLYAVEGYAQNQLPSGRSSGELYALTGISSANGGGSTASAWALKARVSATNSSSIGTAYGVDVQITDLSASAGTNVGYGFHAQFTNTTTLATAYAVYAKAMGGKATNAYSFWSDEQGVYRIRSDNTFDSVYQAISALYNPRFTKYVAGAANFERIVQQWETDVATIRTEAGGTGSLRSLNLGGASVLANGVPVVTTSGSQALSNKTGNISQWTNDSNFTTLAAVAGVGYLTSVAETNLSFTDITTANVSITKHGLTPKLPNDATKFLCGDGSWSVPAGGGGGGGDAQTANPLSQFAATTSAQLAGVISDETGSGLLVFATSPVLTTPNLGTPSAATLTNATGLPISTGVSGLGSGVATFLATPSSANLAAAVTDETGSGALVFATSPSLTTPAIGVATGTRLTLSPSGAAGLTVTGATETTSQPLLSLTQTWNASTTFVGIDANFTVTSSNNSGIFLRLRRGGTANFSVSEFGGVIAASYNDGIFNSSNLSNHLTISSGKGINFAISGSGQSGALYAGSAGNAIEQRNGTNAQTWRWYETFTDTSNYERGAVTMGSDALTLAWESAGTGAANGDIVFVPKGTGAVKFGTHSAIAAETITGYITIKDAGGTARKLAVVS